uniref:CCHC-type domain-containing protein n=2 Tax=Haemonchus contortus TaxID=6289 RepID=A0A7I4YCV6_HAECO
MSEEFWGTLMRQPQEVRQGEPLLMDIETIEIVIADHLQTLTSLHDTLANLRLNVQNMKDQETLAFENYVRSTLSKLEQLTMEVKTIVVESAHSRERKPDPPEHDNVGEREEIQRIQDEDEIIERNANFMEGIEEPEEGAEEGDWEPAEPEEAGEEGDGEPVGAEEDPVDDFPNGLMEEDDEAISRIQRELRNTEQAILDFDRMMLPLEGERLCPPRRYDQGHINKAHERFMRCVFCEAVGYHYSDSCTVVRDVASRNQLIESNKRCKQCLEVICARGLACKKNLTICFYCRRRGHHSALCEFPDYCDTIRTRKANAHEARRRSFARLLRLREELASLENHP